MLYLIPTPIGNLGDMTLRAIDTLGKVDTVLAEDTRKTGRLLKHFSIDKPMLAYHAHNEHKILTGIIEQMKQGKTYGLVSDAGMPSISDPGFLLVRACYENDLLVTCLPGPSAVVTALAVSGMPSERFFFEGFLPHKKGRQTRWKVLSELGETIVLYESPHRLLKTVKEIVTHFGEDHQIAIVKEISKLHETVYRGSVSRVLQDLTDLPSIKGEFVVVISK